MSHSDGKIFIIDDDNSVRRSLGRLLKAAGYQVESFASADEFLRRLPRDTVGCLVLDVQLPGMNGLELQEKLGGCQYPLPIVFITGHRDLQMHVRAMKAGASAFLAKPFGEETLLEAVEQALAESRKRKDSGNT